MSDETPAKSVKPGDTIWIPNPKKHARVSGWPRTVITQEEADKVNAALAAGRQPFLPDIYQAR